MERSRKRKINLGGKAGVEMGGADEIAWRARNARYGHLTKCKTIRATDWPCMVVKESIEDHTLHGRGM